MQKKDKSRKLKSVLVLCLKAVLALTVVFALNSRVELVEECYTLESLMGCMAMQFADAFSVVGLGDILEFSMIIIMFNFIEKKEIPNNLLMLGFSFCLAFIYWVCMSFKLFDDITLITATRFQTVLFLYDVIGYTVLIYTLLRIAYYFADSYVCCNSRSDNSAQFVDSRIIRRNSAIVLFVCLFPWIIINYPGSFNPDSISQLQQFFGDIEMTGHHPPFSTFIMGSVVSLGMPVSANFGVFLYTVINLIAAVIVFSYEIKKIYEWGCGIKACYITLAFFCIFPIWGARIQWIEKSFIYSLLAAYIVIELIDASYKRTVSNRHIVCIVIASMVGCLLRNDGKFLIVPCVLIIAMFVSSRREKIKIIAGVAVVVAVVMTTTNVVYPSMGIREGSVAESLSLPFMQTARYVKAFDDEVTTEERQAINDVLIYDEIAERYNPVLSDPVKSTYSGDNSKLPAYFNVWFKMFFKHPNVYVSAFINKSYGYLAPVISSVDANFDYGVEGFTEEIGVTHQNGEIPKAFYNMAHIGTKEWPIFKYTAMCGTYTWILSVCLIYVLCKRKWKYTLLYIPAVINLLICIASPCHANMRYYLAMVIATPAYIMCTLNAANRTTDESVASEGITTGTYGC